MTSDSAASSITTILCIVWEFVAPGTEKVYVLNDAEYDIGI